MITYQLTEPQEFKEQLIELLDIFQFNQREDKEYKKLHYKGQVYRIDIYLHFGPGHIAAYEINLRQYPSGFMNELIPPYGHEELFLPIYALMKKHGQAEWNITMADILNRPFRMNIERYYDLLSFVSKLTGKDIDGLGSLYSACIA